MAATPATDTARAGSGAARALSLLLAGPLSLWLLVYPVGLLDREGRYSHALVSLLLWGIAAGFVHGLGYRPEARLWRWCFGPAAAWLLCLGSVLALLVLRAP